MHRQKHSAILNHAFIALGFVLRQAHPDQRPDNAAKHTSGSHPAERTHDWPRRDKWPEAWNRQGADTRQPTKSSADDGAGCRASGRAFRRLGVFLVRELLVALVIG